MITKLFLKRQLATAKKRKTRELFKGDLAMSEFKKVNFSKDYVSDQPEGANLSNCKSDK